MYFSRADASFARARAAARFMGTRFPLTKSPSFRKIVTQNGRCEPLRHGMDFVLFTPTIARGVWS